MKQIAVQRLFDALPRGVYVGLLSVFAVMLSMTIVHIYLSDAFADSNSAGISYRSNTGTGTTQAPKYREWNASALAWSAETVLADTGSPVRFAWIEYSPISTKRVIVTLSDDGTLNAFTCSASCATTSNWVQHSDFADLWSTAPTGAQRPFDLEFENTSGELVLVYDKVSTVAAEDLFYRVMPAGSNQFGTEGSIDNSNTLLSSDTVYSFARLSSKKTASTDDLALIALDETNSAAVAWVWNGSTDSWGSEKTITLLASIGTEEVVGIAHETSSGDIIAAAGSSTSMFYCEFTGGSWCITPTTFGTIAIGNINWVTIKADPVSSSNGIFVAETGASSDLDSQYWSGSAWTDHSEHDAGIDGHASRVADFAWDNTGSQGVLIWGTASGSLSYKTFSGTSTFSSASTFTETGTHPWVQLADSPNPTSGDTLSSMGATLDSTLDIGGIRWDGASSAPVSTGDGGITADTTATTYENFKVAWQLSNTAPTWDRTMSEGLALADGQAKNPSKRVSENLGLSDSLQFAVAFLQELNDAVALADNRSFNAGRRLDEIVGVSDAKTFSSSTSFSENLSLVDARSASILFSNSLSENLAADDFVSAATAKVLLENTGLSDSIDTSSFFVRSMSENLALEDMASTVTSFSKLMSENVAASETLIKSTGKSISENMALADTITSATEYVRLILENLAAGEALANSASMSLTESVAAADQFGHDFVKTVIETVSLSDVTAGSVSFVHDIAENIALADLASVAAEYSKSLAESLALDDLSTTVSDLGKSLTENLAISDGLSSAAQFVFPLSENLALTDSITSFFDLVISLSESLAVVDSISDIFMDIQLGLGESLALIISFFTPEVGYQSSLVSEGVGIADTLQFGTQYNVVLNETLDSQDSITPQKIAPPEEDETDAGDEAGGGRGGGGSGGSRPAEEPPVVDTQPGVGKNLRLRISETIRLQSEQNSSSIQSDGVKIDLYGKFNGVSTSSQLIPPAATVSVTFEIDNNGNGTEGIVLEYWYVDEKTGVGTFVRAQEFVSTPHQPMLEKVDIPFLSPGEYSVIGIVKTTNDNVIQDMTSIEITVSPMAVYVNGVLAIVAESAASTGGYIFWVTRRKGTDKKDGAPL